jgi:hypothetical protein
MKEIKLSEMISCCYQILPYIHVMDIFLIVAAGLCETNNIEGKECWRIIDEVIADLKQRSNF